MQAQQTRKERCLRIGTVFSALMVVVGLAHSAEDPTCVNNLCKDINAWYWCQDKTGYRYDKPHCTQCTGANGRCAGAVNNNCGLAGDTVTQYRTTVTTVCDCNDPPQSNNVVEATGSGGTSHLSQSRKCCGCTGD